MDIGKRLSEDKWFAQNTLQFVCTYLNLKELLNAAKVCRMWECIIMEQFLHNLFIPTCTKHIENIIEEHGKSICCLQIVDTHQIVLQASVFKTVSCPESFNVTNCHPTLISQLGRQEYDLPLRNTFIKKIPNLSSLRLYTDRMIFVKDPNREAFKSDVFYWRSLLRAKYLTNVELGLHVPSNFGLKVLKHLTHLEVLKLHLYSGFDEHIFKSLTSLKNFKELTLLKTHVNEDLTTFLPTLKALQKVTIMIRAPSDTHYYYLLSSVKKLQSLEHFIWIVNDVTVSNVFFSQNCQTFLNLNNSLVNKQSIETALKTLFSGIKTHFLLADTQYFPQLQKKFKKCCHCIDENLCVQSGMSIDIEDDPLIQSGCSTYDIGEVNLFKETKV